MKTTKKILTLSLGIALLCSLFLISSCKKEAGPAGANGKDGNANVKSFLFLDDTLGNGFEISHLIPLTKSEVDSSIYLIYYTDKGNGLNNSFWYQSPGLGTSGNYQTRCYINTSGSVNALVKVQALSPSGGSYGTTISIEKLRVIIIKPSSFAFGKKDPVDYSDYKATMKYYGLPE